MILTVGKRPLWWAAAVAVGVALAFALYTDHAWEDWYITYRASKNLATGHGLVFNVGDRLHTFTSPLGVLLPALSYLLTGNSSDPGALWVFRVLSAAAFGGAAAFLFAAARQLRWTPVAAALLVGWLVTDGKSVDFTINGMETGFLLLFLAYAWWAQLAGDLRRRAWHLGAAWAGLMWTRPDGFVYVGLMCAASWLWNEPERSGLTRGGWLRVYLQAGLWCTALYLPWLLWSWHYYGTPVPHTIAAKSVAGRDLAGLAKMFVQLPLHFWQERTSLEGAFLPSYYMIGGWPAGLLVAGRVVALGAALLWLVPGIGRPTRAASLVFYGAHVYVSYFPSFPFPWYLPGASLFGFFALAGFAATLASGMVRFAGDRGRHAQWLLAACLLAAPLWVLLATARQAEAQQRIVETGNRRPIGKWLRENSRPGDTVFLEPLGYIGFYSRLKTYDFPGMSSREMVQARREVGEDWSALVRRLKPRWLVLRPGEAEAMEQRWPGGLTRNYVPARAFDVHDAVAALDVRGRPYLAFDSRFTVYRREWVVAAFDDFTEKQSDVFVTPTTLFERPMVFAHANSRLTLPVPAGSTRCRVGFAFQPGAYTETPPTDGAVFEVEWVDGETRQTLLRRRLDPVAQPHDRALQEIELELPAGASPRAVLHLRTDRDGHGVRDLTCWTLPEFKLP